jgi:hypothetical protein
MYTDNYMINLPKTLASYQCTKLNKLHLILVEQHANSSSSIESRSKFNTSFMTEVANLELVSSVCKKHPFQSLEEHVLISNLKVVNGVPGLHSLPFKPLGKR